MWKNFRNKYLVKPPLAQEGEINHAAIDRFILVHFIIGIVYSLLRLGFWLMLCLAVLWELIENPLKVNFSFVFPRGTADTAQDMILDCIAVILGWVLINSGFFSFLN